MRDEKLKELERRAAELRADAQLVTVQFSNGTQRTMRAADVIPLFVGGGELTVTDVTSGANSGSGKLLELLRGSLEDSSYEQH